MEVRSPAPRRDTQALIATVSTLRDRDLARKAPGGTVSIEAVVYGIACHDVYHAGQVQLIKRQVRVKSKGREEDRKK